MKDFTLVNLDTDSITVSKKDGSPFSELEQKNLLDELNSIYPENIKWEPDGYFPVVIVLRAKNYILYDGKKKKIKGSSMRDPKREKALRELINRFIDSLIEERSDLVEIYKEYAKEIYAIKDINRWSIRKTLSEKVYSSERSNETKVVDAIHDTEYVEGDRVYMYYKPDDTLCLVERFDGEYNKPTKNCR